MEQLVKNAHYVPKMYIKRFSSNKERIAVWKLDGNVILSNQNPENFATRRFYYDSSENELNEAFEEFAKIRPDVFTKLNLDDKQYVEKMLSREEKDADRVIDSICKNGISLLNEEDRNTLLIFLHDLTYRTEKYRDLIDNNRTQLLAFMSKLGIESTADMDLKKTGKDAQLYQLLGIKPTLETGRMLIENYNWYLGIVPGSMKLVISDNPAQGIMIKSPDICIPLCGDKAIVFRIANPDAPLLSRDMPTGNKIILSGRSVLAYNAIQLSYANRFLFGDESSLAILKKLSDENGIIEDPLERPIINT